MADTQFPPIVYKPDELVDFTDLFENVYGPDNGVAVPAYNAGLDQAFANLDIWAAFNLDHQAAQLPDLVVDEPEKVQTPVKRARPSSSSSTVSFATAPGDKKYAEKVLGFVAIDFGFAEFHTCRHQVNKTGHKCDGGAFKTSKKSGYKKLNLKALLHMGKFHAHELSTDEYSVYLEEKVKASATSKVVDAKRKAKLEEAKRAKRGF